MYRSTMICVLAYMLFKLVLISAAPKDSCIVLFPDEEKEKQTFKKLESKGVTAIYLNFRDANGTVIKFDKKWNQEKWLWIRNEYRNFLTYSEDVNVFSFGLLGINISAINILADISNIENCTQNYKSHFLNHISTITMTNSTKGSVCYSIIEDSYWKNYLSNYTAVSIGYDFLCFNKGDPTAPVMIHKSTISYVIIALVILVYLYFPMVMHFSAPDGEVKNAIRNYYVSDSPFSPKRCLLNLFFRGGTQCGSVIRILFVLFVFTIFSYIFTWLVYMDCNCVLKSSNVILHFQHLTYLQDSYQFKREGSIKTENIWETQEGTLRFRYAVLFGIWNFQNIFLSMILNINGAFDDFLVIDFSNVFKKGSFLRAIPLHSFFPKGYFESKHQSYYKMSKFSLITSYQFWCKILLIKSLRPESKLKRGLLLIVSLIQFPLNVVLVILSTFCPTVSTLYFFLLKFGSCYLFKYSRMIYQSIRDLPYDVEGQRANRQECHEFYCEIICFDCETDDSRCPYGFESFMKEFIEFFSHLFTLTYVILSHMYGADFILHSMSYLLQFLITTVFIAIPHLTLHKLTYVIFITSFVGFLGRHVYYFLQLYKELLKNILKMTGRNMIKVKDFQRIVGDFFPLRNELFSLVVKLLLTSLFFVIAFDTMNKVGYLNYDGKLPDISAFFALLFLFGPPRLMEVIFVKNYTSLVYMKHNEILNYISVDNFGATNNITQESDVVCPNPKECTILLESRSCIYLLYSTFYSIFKQRSFVDKLENTTTIFKVRNENSDTDNDTDNSKCSLICSYLTNCMYRLCFACCKCPGDHRTGECIFCVSFSEDVEESFDQESYVFLNKTDITNDYVILKIPGFGQSSAVTYPSEVEITRE